MRKKEKKLMKENENSISSQTQRVTGANDSKVRKKYEKPVLTTYSTSAEAAGRLSLCIRCVLLPERLAAANPNNKRKYEKPVLTKCGPGEEAAGSLPLCSPCVLVLERVAGPRTLLTSAKS